MEKSMNRTAIEDRIIDVVVYATCALVLFLTLYPFYYILIISLNDGIDASLGGIYWWPRTFTLANFEGFFNDPKWIAGLVISVLRTVIGTVFSVFFTAIVAYGLSFRELAFRKTYMVIIILSMYFSGGVIPYYAVLKALHLINTFGVYVIPGAVNVFFLLVGISFFQEIPPSLRESAILDGASEMRVFRKIILPISSPFIATLVLFVAVGHWNNWYDTAFFVHDKGLRTLSYLMKEVINSSLVTTESANAGASVRTTPLSVQTAAMVISTLPIICTYPFLQKYFVKGLMIGSVKE